MPVGPPVRVGRRFGTTAAAALITYSNMPTSTHAVLGVFDPHWTLDGRARGIEAKRPDHPSLRTVSGAHWRPGTGTLR